MKTLTNPIENTIQIAIDNSKQISIAVPFLSHPTVKRLFKSEQMEKIQKKRIIIKLDDSHSISYDLAAIKHLIECGFEIVFDNDIHLKLYILGEQVFISSGNLTDSGLKYNVELTVQTNEEESNVLSIFEALWKKNRLNKITLNFIKQNWEKYLFLKNKFPREKMVTSIINPVKLSISDEQLIDFVLYHEKNWSWHSHMIELVNNRRNKLLLKLKENGFNEEYFYAPMGNPNRDNSLYYQFTYGKEEKLAGTGLREEQFKDVFTSSQFEDLLFYIYPQYKQTNYYWDFSNVEEIANFCKGLFDFKIRSYKEAMPIRLASYFYPEQFLPVFNLHHLSEMCSIFKFEASANDLAIKLFECNIFLKDRLKDVPYNNFIKSTILYKLLYAMKVKREIDQNGIEGIKEFINGQNRKWIRDEMNKGLDLLHKMESLTINK